MKMQRLFFSLLPRPIDIKPTMASTTDITDGKNCFRRKQFGMHRMYSVVEPVVAQLNVFYITWSPLTLLSPQFFANSKIFQNGVQA